MHFFHSRLIRTASKPHVAPTDEPKLKTKRNVSAGAKGRKRAEKEKGMERAQKLEKRRDSVEGKKDKKKRAKALWE